MVDFHIESFILFVVNNPPPPLISSLFLPFLDENLLLSVFPPLFYYYPMFYCLSSFTTYLLNGLYSWLLQKFQGEHRKAKI